MDHSRFDDLSRALAISSRRSVLTAAATALLAALVGGPDPEPALARRKKKKRKKKPSACPANTSLCAADGRCIATDLCCSDSLDCPVAASGSLECNASGVCVCGGSNTAPGQLANGDYFCCNSWETVCNSGCCRPTCTVEAGGCTCPNGSGPCQGADPSGSSVPTFSCCADGDTCCYATRVECCTDTCTAANSARGEPQTFCDDAFTCRCMTRIDTGAPVCMNIIGGPPCSPNCPTNGCAGPGEICVDSVSCDSSQPAPACGTPCS